MKNKIEILACIDRSGSMSSMAVEAAGAFNQFIQEQKELDLADEVFVTLRTFDHQHEIVFDRVPLQEVREITVEDIKPRGATALFDAIGYLITRAKHPEHDTIVLIQTDGEENCSEKFTKDEIVGLITSKQDDGWDVNFIGAGIDAMSAGVSMGFAADKSITVSANAEGMELYGATLSSVSCSYRTQKFNENK